MQGSRVWCSRVEHFRRPGRSHPGTGRALPKRPCCVERRGEYSQRGKQNLPGTVTSEWQARAFLRARDLFQKRSWKGARVGVQRGRREKGNGRQLGNKGEEQA